jgi:hypothetical protein
MHGSPAFYDFIICVRKSGLTPINLSASSWRHISCFHRESNSIVPFPGSSAASLSINLKSGFRVILPSQYLNSQVHHVNKLHHSVPAARLSHGVFGLLAMPWTKELGVERARAGASREY